MLTKASFLRRRISRIAVLASGIALFMVLALTNLPSEASGGSSNLPRHDQAPHSPYLSPTPNPACGLAWRMVSAQGTSYELGAVAAASPNDVWAVGGPYRTFAALVMQWNGSVWNQQISPNPSPTHNHLVAISVVSANDIWAAGYYEEDDIDRLL